MTGPAILLLLAAAAAPSAADKADARRLKDEAFTLIAEGRYADGIDRLEAAYESVPHPTFLFNIAVVYDQWAGHCAESLAAFERFFAACADCKVRPTAETRFARVKERCNVRLSIETTPPGAAVQVDDVDRGASPLDVELEPGRHRVEVESEGFEPTSEEVLLEPGRDQTLSLNLVPARARPELTATAPPPARSPLRTWGWVAIGAGAAGVGMAIVYTALAVDSTNQEEELRNTPGVDPTEVVDARDEARSRATLAYVGYGIGAVGVGTGVLLHVLAGKKESEQTVRVGTDGRGLVLSGRF